MQGFPEILPVSVGFISRNSGSWKNIAGRSQDLPRRFASLSTGQCHRDEGRSVLLRSGLKVQLPLNDRIVGGCRVA
jgi:hypothetical protein